MAELPHGDGPKAGLDSFGAMDHAILAGFMAPGVALAFGQRKIASGRIRARVAAVEL